MKKTLTLAGILLAVVVVGFGIWEISNLTAGPQGTFSSMEIQGSNILVDGHGFSKVEVWATPSASGADELLGSATLVTTNGDGDQSWSMLIPAQPLPISSVYAKGYNANGRAGAKFTLPAINPTDLYQKLWGTGRATTTVTQ